MSADNGIYILHTKDTWKNINEYMVENMKDSPVDAYRVAHTQAIENFNRYKKNELYNLGVYMNGVWGGSDVFYTLEEALEEAKKILEKVEWTEYGTSVIDATKYSFINE